MQWEREVVLVGGGGERKEEGWSGREGRDRQIKIFSFNNNAVAKKSK